MNGPWEDPRVGAGLDRQFALRRQMLLDGSLSLGWKVGFGAPASLELMQIGAPLLGFLTDTTLFESGAIVDASGWTRGVVEFEVAVYLGSDLGPGATEEEAAAAVSSVGPAIELADVNLPVAPVGVTEIVAANIFHTGLILGDPDQSRAGLDISGLVARILVDGTEVANTADLEAITGRYPQIVSTVADTLAANNQLLKAGDVIITGSVIPPIPVSSGTDFTFSLDPFKAISVRIT